MGRSQLDTVQKLSNARVTRVLEGPSAGTHEKERIFAGESSATHDWRCQWRYVPSKLNWILV